MKKSKTNREKYPRITIRVSEKLLVALHTLALAEDRKPSELARLILKERVLKRTAA